MQAERAEQAEKIAREVAALVRPHLQARLVAIYGADWLAAINTKHERGGQDGRPSRRRSLSDHRFCLKVFAYDDATYGWAPDDLRYMARKLLGIANQAHHDDPPLTDSDLERAQSIISTFRRSLSLLESPKENQDTEPASRRPSRGDDITIHVVLLPEEIRAGVVKRVQLGESPRASAVRVRIPPDLNPRKRLKLAGRGKPGHNGGPAGDAYIKVIVEEPPPGDHEEPSRGDSAIVRLVLTPQEVHGGCEREIEIDGRKIRIRIPPDVEHRKIVLKGEGRPGRNGGEPGNVYVELVVKQS